MIYSMPLNITAYYKVPYYPFYNCLCRRLILDIS